MSKLLDPYTHKEYEPTMRIAEVHPKPGTRHNLIHDELVGRVCIVDQLKRGADAVILFEPAYDPGVLHHLYTTSVRNIDSWENAIRFETRNTVYKLEALEEF